MAPRIRSRSSAALPLPEVKRLAATVRQHGAGNAVDECVYGIGIRIGIGNGNGNGNGHEVPTTARCANPACRDGGYRLRPFGEAMRAARLAEQTWSAACRGRANGRSAHRGEPCADCVEVTVRIDYA